mmetsp:Transcript_5697/g.17757  ORF Transcript_5697/g.17757 Transcript_5697/m.17757 type:complete len:122 (-) Transcript_5697:908-1273(-)
MPSPAMTPSLLPPPISTAVTSAAITVHPPHKLRRHNPAASVLATTGPVAAPVAACALATTLAAPSPANLAASARATTALTAAAVNAPRRPLRDHHCRLPASPLPLTPSCPPPSPLPPLPSL